MCQFHSIPISKYCFYGSPGWIVARIALRMNLTLPVNLTLDPPNESRIRFHRIHMKSIPMTDPWCWYIYANLGYIDGKCYHIWIYIYIAYMDPMGYKNSIITTFRKKYRLEPI